MNGKDPKPIQYDIKILFYAMIIIGLIASQLIWLPFGLVVCMWSFVAVVLGFMQLSRISLPKPDETKSSPLKTETLAPRQFGLSNLMWLVTIVACIVAQIALMSPAIIAGVWLIIGVSLIVVRSIDYCRTRKFSSATPGRGQFSLAVLFQITLVVAFFFAGLVNSPFLTAILSLVFGASMIVVFAINSFRNAD